LGERKVDYSEYKDLEELYNNDHQQYIEYNIHDVDLVKQILDKLKILQFLFALAYKTKTRFTDISSAVRIWTSYLSYVLYDRGVILPVNKHNNEKTEKFSGAVVFDPQVGKFDWVAVYDINSLYPNLITSLNIDHKALISKGFLVNKFGEDNEDVKYLFSVVNEDCRLPIEPHDILNDRIPERLFTSIHNLNICLAGNGYFFDSSKESLFAELMNLNYSERKEFQKEKTKYEKLYKETNDEKYNLLASAFNVKQLGTKIFINSFFGFLGNPYGSLYDLRLAEAITLTGQVVTTHSSRVINKTINNVTNKNHNYIVGADTDSNMFFLKDVISTNTYEEQLNESIAFCNNVITPALRNGFDDLKNHLNFMTNKIKMDMEALASSAFFRAKKNYAMNVVYSEGVVLDKPKLKIKGLEAVKRSAFPEYTRNAITEIIKIILTQTEENAREFIRKVKVDFFNEKAYNIASPRGVGDFEKYIGIDGHPTKGAQAHIKGCILYNRLTEPYRSKYKRIHNGDKIKFLPLIKENPYGYNCLAFIEDIPEEIGIRNYIDIESHYKKTFLNVVQSLLDVVKWKHEKGNYNLFSFTEE
jgi:DNA polymerase elongation subunit (family B)